MKHMHSLRTKITTLTVCVTVIAVFVVSLMSVLFIRRTEHGKSNQLLLLLCETGERNLDYYFRSVENSVKDMAATTKSDITGKDDESFSQHVERMREVFDRIANKTNGVLTYYYRIDPAFSETVKGFWYTNLDGTGFREHEVTDINEFDTSDTTKLVWFTVPKYEKEAVWLPPYITDNLDKQVISYNIPIRWRGEFVGVVGIEIDYSTMKEQVESIHLYDNGYAFLTDSEGNLIFHPRIDIAALNADQIPATPDGLLSDITFTEYTFEGTRKEAVWQSLSNGMRLYVSVPENETEGEWQLLINRILIAAAAVIALSVILTRLVTARITKPLEQLTEAAKLTNEGSYDFKLEYNGKDEVGTLTNSFRRMTEHMKEHISDLNKRANVDSLTSVRNKGAFSNYIDDMQARIEANPENVEYAIGVFDCDDLKTVNDRYGHDKGDIYLKTASRLICRVFQHSPVFRIGGDEFAVVLRNDDFRNREKLTEAFESGMKEACLTAKNRWEEIHVAMGIAVYDPQQDASVIDTVRRADKEMYSNKRKHKDEPRDNQE